MNEELLKLLDGNESLLCGAENTYFIIDGNYSDLKADDTCDIKAEIYKKKEVCLADVSAGMAYSLPVSELSADYSIAKYRTKFYFGDSVLSVSAEASNPYTTPPYCVEQPWFVYCSEWLIRHIVNEDLLKHCHIKRLYKPKHALTKEEPYGDLDVKKGYDVYSYGFLVEGEVEYPYYHIAVIREEHENVKFALFVLKSKTNQKKVIDKIIESFTRFTPKGVQKNYFNAGQARENPNWSEETKAYFNLLSNETRTHWGVFSYSMPGHEEELVPSNEIYKKYYKLSVDMETLIEKAWGKPYDIYPTYTHIGNGLDYTNYKPHHFPLKMAKALAGGNGFNGKPVLQFTYQFTLNNNGVLEEQTPMFDILRGKFDEQFRRLARDIKAYEQPVLFRLNNEMNTDWTSYCGILTLCDPDVFQETWRRLYRIFEEEGVNNAIWIWNPVAETCPFSSWNEDLSYFPGVEYVQLLGGTSYEMNNYEKEEAAQKIVTFQTHYERLYNKNKAAFSKWSMIISEFACGSGGDLSGELGRNVPVQAQWVRDMFTELHKEPRPEWVQPIKGAIWFNCNDVVDGKVSNRLRFIDPECDCENETVQAFRECFIKG